MRAEPAHDRSRLGKKQSSCRAARIARCAGLLLLLASRAAAAQDAPSPARFEYRLGGQVFSSFSSVLRLDSETRQIGTELHLEDDVDLEERISIGRAEGLYSFNDRHHAAFAVYDISRTGRRALTRDVRFGDEQYTVDATVNTRLEERVVKLNYGFTAFERPRWTFGPLFGLHVMQLAAGMALVTQPQLDDASTTAPLPVVGARGEYRFGDRWRLRGSLEWFDVELNDASGSFADYLLSVEHDTFERFGFGLGLNNIDLDLESGDADFRGALHLSFRSALLYFKGSVGRRVVNSSSHLRTTPSQPPAISAATSASTGAGERPL